jgi:beta-glucuronidase
MGWVSFCKFALFGNYGDAQTRWTEEYQESLYVHQIAMLRRIPFLRGTTPWILKDFRSSRRTLPSIEDYLNRKGLVSERCGLEKVPELWGTPTFISQNPVSG